MSVFMQFVVCFGMFMWAHWFSHCSLSTERNWAENKLHNQRHTEHVHSGRTGRWTAVHGQHHWRERWRDGNGEHNAIHHTWVYANWTVWSSSCLMMFLTSDSFLDSDLWAKRLARCEDKHYISHCPMGEGAGGDWQVRPLRCTQSDRWIRQTSRVKPAPGERFGPDRWLAAGPLVWHLVSGGERRRPEPARIRTGHSRWVSGWWITAWNWT